MRASAWFIAGFLAKFRDVMVKGVFVTLCVRHCFEAQLILLGRRNMLWRSELMCPPVQWVKAHAQ